MVMPASNLSFYIGELTRLVSSNVDQRDWDSMLFTEQLEIDPETLKILKKDSIWEANDYQPRFNDLLCSGHAWINMHACGVLKNRLIVDIRWPKTRKDTYKTTSVNLSGPEKWIQDRGCSLIGLMEVEK